MFVIRMKKYMKTFSKLWNFTYIHVMLFELPHDKTNKMSVRPAKTQISLGIRPVWSAYSLCAKWVAKGPMFSSYGQRRLWSDRADAQADLSLRWAHDHIAGFVMRRLIYFVHNECILTRLRFKYTTKFSLPKIACPAIVYAEIVVVFDLYFVGVCPWIKFYRYNPT